MKKATFLFSFLLRRQISDTETARMMNNGPMRFAMLGIVFSMILLSASTVSAQWVRQSSPMPGDFWSVRFFSEDIGWLRGGTDSLSYLLKTTDSGSSWIIQESWGTACPVAYCPTGSGGLCIVDSLTVLYSRSVKGGNDVEVRRTTDGGASWTTVDSLQGVNPITEVEFVDSQTGYSVGGDLPLSEYDGYLRKSSDGGATWSELFVDEEYDFSGVSFVDSMNGWIIGNSVLGPYLLEAVFHTTDGGLTWTRVGINGGNVSLKDIQFTTADSGWIVGGGYGNSQYLTRTTDGGASWSSWYEDSCMPTECLVDPGLCTGQFEEIQMVSSQTGWIAAKGCLLGILRTTDGGVTWETQINWEIPGFQSISLLNEYDGWACGQEGNLFRTSNGGIT